MSFLSQTGWQPSSVAKIIHSRAVMGEYQPHKRDADGRRVPDGDPIKDYYTVVIDQDLWLQANAAVTSRRKDAGGCVSVGTQRRRQSGRGCKSARWNDPAQINDVNELSCRSASGPRADSQS